MNKSFVSPNLRFKDSKIYYLNKYELNIHNWDYVNENYFYNIEDVNTKFNECNINIITNNENDKIKINCEFKEELNDDKIKKILNKVNIGICYLENSDVYNFDIIC